MPFHEFNAFSGRLKQSTHFQPLFPLSARKPDLSESPKMIWDTVKTKPLKTATTSAAFLSTVEPKILSKMKKFQADIEKPVYIMGGKPDKILFGVSCVLVTAGVLQCLKLFYDMANPKKE